jgi:hypothetical protein
VAKKGTGNFIDIDVLVRPVKIVVVHKIHELNISIFSSYSSDAGFLMADEFKTGLICLS